VHPIGPDAVGQHLLLVEPDVVGGYRNKRGRGGGRQLVVQRDALQYATGVQFYNSIKQRAVLFDPNARVTDLRRELLARTGIGRWDPEWTSETEYRSPDYFDLYDRHIRCWIPLYNQMISDCASNVSREVLRIYSSSKRPVDLLEVGYGTGSLTLRLLPWIENINRPFSELDHPGPVHRYRGVDRAERMTRHAREVVEPDRRPHLDIRLQRGVAWESIPPHRYDVVFGSLVMHFLTGPDPTEETIDRFFANCNEYTAEESSLVFADAFGADDESQSARRVENWRQWMISHGMSPSDVETFLEGNSDMTKAASTRRLKAAAGRHGFRCDIHWVGRKDLPFEIIVLRKMVPDAAGGRAGQAGANHVDRGFQVRTAHADT
jgi:hypothetical protein